MTDSPDSSDNAVCVRFVVKGVVQGVGFREATVDEAKKIGGLLGWVRNLANGDVEVVVQGQPTKINGMKKWLHSGGPDAARVDEVDEKKLRTERNLPSFGIRRL